MLSPVAASIVRCGSQLATSKGLDRWLGMACLEYPNDVDYSLVEEA